MLYKIPWFVRSAIADALRSNFLDIPSLMEPTEHPDFPLCFYLPECVIIPGPVELDDPSDSWTIVTFEYELERHTLIQQVSDFEYTILRSELVTPSQNTKITKE